MELLAHVYIINGLQLIHNNDFLLDGHKMPKYCLGHFMQLLALAPELRLPDCT
jgi:hypothetical protein